MKKTVYNTPMAELFELTSREDILSLSNLVTELETDNSEFWFGGLNDPYYMG